MAKSSKQQKVVESKEVATVKQSELDQRDMNFFEAYGEAASLRTFVGSLLKFNKGDFLFGQDNEEMEVGTKLVACMDTFSVGWVKWVDNKPQQQLTGLLMEGFKPAPRSTLGDLDDAEWEVDTSGKARDPWQYTNFVVLKRPGKNSDDLFTFTTSSKGGIGALGALCKYYGKEMRAKPDAFPIVELQIDKYKHSNPEFGLIKVPVFKPVGWEQKSLFKLPAAA